MSDSVGIFSWIPCLYRCIYEFIAYTVLSNIFINCVSFIERYISCLYLSSCLCIWTNFIWNIPFYNISSKYNVLYIDFRVTCHFIRVLIGLKMLRLFSNVRNLKIYAVDIRWFSLNEAHLVLFKFISDYLPYLEKINILFQYHEKNVCINL